MAFWNFGGIFIKFNYKNKQIKFTYKKGNHFFFEFFQGQWKEETSNNWIDDIGYLGPYTHEMKEFFNFGHFYDYPVLIVYFS